MQSFFAGLAASGTATSALRLVTKAAFESSQNGLRKGACETFMLLCACEKVLKSLFCGLA